MRFQLSSWMHQAGELSTDQNISEERKQKQGLKNGHVVQCSYITGSCSCRVYTDFDTLNRYRINIFLIAWCLREVGQKMCKWSPKLCYFTDILNLCLRNGIYRHKETIDNYMYCNFAGTSNCVALHIYLTFNLCLRNGIYRHKETIDNNRNFAIPITCVIQGMDS